jgi:hypothetical protein
VDSFPTERVHRYNAENLDGLFDRPLPGRRPMLDAEQMQALAEIVDAAPTPRRTA